MSNQLLFNDRVYEVTEDEEKVIFTDTSNEKLKINFSFSKDPVKNKIAKEGLTIFFTELFS
ncbi:hypothetical protein [Neobacillus sp. FSL H8-0543]|uniref:hypothetical protein n=1 Tax=Neobacillus sp. FSL H8-0543 TaxID=2954672 RepID=UPI0031583297